MENSIGYRGTSHLKYVRLRRCLNRTGGAYQYDPDGLGNLIYKQASGQVLFDGAAYGEDDYGPHAITSANIVSGVFPADNQQ
ncbi:MAG: hypothetical protein K0B11_22595, partial [Mariniphaga sp.]|nr:hypothetical protein [Mariniphaga sp.]